MNRSALVSSFLAGALLLAGCSGGAAGTASPTTGSSASPSVEASATPPPAPADATDEGTTTDGTTTDGTADDGTADDGTADDGTADDGTADDGTADDGTADDGTADDGTAAGTSAPQDPGDEGTGNGPGNGTEGLPGWPIESTPTHGARLWAAYVAVGAPGDPALQQVLADVQELWPGAGLGELACDEGAAEALGRDRSEHAVAVYFPTEQHVTEFRRRWEAPFVGAVRVTTLCAD
ncbi:hypothetical protein [Geodermatophilus sp. SYSU D00698]